MHREATPKAGWTTVAFGDVVRQVKDKVNPDESGLERYVAGDHMDTDDLCIRRWGTIGHGYLGPAFHMRFKPGHVLYGSRRTYLRKVAVADFEGITANTTYVLESRDTNILLPELLPFIMQSDAFNQHSVRESKGSVNPYVNFSDLAWFEFALPPIAEQQRIARLLVAQEAFRRSLFDLLRTIQAVESAYLETQLVENADEWTLVPVDDLLSEPPRNGLSPSTNSDSRGLRTVSIGAVAFGKFDPDGQIKYAEVDYSIAEPYFVTAGDIFVVRGNGNRYLAGKAGIATADFDGLFYPDLLIRLRFDASRILPEFALSQWNLPSVHLRLISRAKSSNGIWKVNGQDVRAHRLALPSMHLQNQILSAVLHCKSCVDQVRHKLLSAEQMKASVIREALVEAT